MPISIYTDVVSALETKDMVRLGEKYGATGQQMCVGLDIAGRSIIDTLAAHAQTMDGAEQVFRKVGEFSGTIVDKIKNGVPLDEMDSVILFGTGCLNQIVGSEFDSLVESVKQEANASHVAAANIVGLTAALILDFLGSYRKKFGLKRDNLTEILRAQQELTIEPLLHGEEVGYDDDSNTASTEQVMQNLGLKPGVIAASAGSPEVVSDGDTTAGVSKVADTKPREMTPTEMAMAVANEVAAMKKTKSISRSNTTKANTQQLSSDSKKKSATAPCPAPRKANNAKPRRKRSKKWLIALPLVLIVGGGVYAWQLFQNQSSSLGDIAATASEKLASYQKPAPTSDSTTDVVASTEGKVELSASESKTKDAASTSSDNSLASTEVTPRTFTGPIALAANSIRTPKLDAKLAQPSSAKSQKSGAQDGWFGTADSLLPDVGLEMPSANLQVANAEANPVQTKKNSTSKREELSRDDPTIASDDWLASSFAVQVRPEESPKSYWWDKETETNPQSGHLKAGAWQVKEKPRNTSQATYFTYR